MTGSRVKGGTPIKILGTPPIVHNAVGALLRPKHLTFSTHGTAARTWLPLFSGLGRAFRAGRLVEHCRNRITPCKGDQKLTFHNAQRFRHMDAQNPPKLLNIHPSYSQELWSVLNDLFTFSVSDSNDGSHLQRTLFHKPVYVSLACH